MSKQTDTLLMTVILAALHYKHARDECDIVAKCKTPGVFTNNDSSLAFTRMDQAEQALFRALEQLPERTMAMIESSEGAASGTDKRV